MGFFWRTFHHYCKITPSLVRVGGWTTPSPLQSTVSTITSKLWGTLQLRGQIHSPYFSSTPICILCCNNRGSFRYCNSSRITTTQNRRCGSGSAWIHIDFGRLEQHRHLYFNSSRITTTENRCCGSGSAWIHIDFGRLDPDPDSEWPKWPTRKEKKIHRASTKRIRFNHSSENSTSGSWIWNCFLHTQRKHHLQASNSNRHAGHPPGVETTPSLPLAATKKLGGSSGAPRDG